MIGCRVSLIMTCLMALISGAQAQSPDMQVAQARPSVAGQPQLDETEVISPSQVRQPRGATPAPAPQPRRSAFDHDPDLPPATRPPAQEPPTNSIARRPPEPNRTTRAVSCAGPFAKGSSHLQLAMNFGSENLTFGDVAGPDGSRLPASILFPKDPKRRLEVLWHDDASRLNTNLIVIEGQSAWSGPRGLRVGMPLAALEKANGKPFKLSAFGPDGLASVQSWEDGALDHIPGGCKIGVRLKADPKAGAPHTPAATTVQGSKDKAVVSARAKIVEIVIGYTR